MTKKIKGVVYLFLTMIVVSCSVGQSQNHAVVLDKAFNDYWYAGEAEITSYELQQSRYGEIHQGEAVLVFVTEPFSKSKQVKLDNWKDARSDNVSVLKLNMTKKFLTGIYPYSMMMSTFKPVSFDQHPRTLKVTTSSQEWCGHTFMQLNLDNNNYQFKGFSYFESEGDINIKLDKGILLEDELWSTIRLNPELLPIGNVEFLPSTFYLRLKHQENIIRQATTTLNELVSSRYNETPHMNYKVKYDQRQLTIFFEKSFPYTILGWEETHSGLTTSAKRINTIKSTYWNKHSNSDRKLREELGLNTQ